jgi:hypothetical protein
MRHCPLLALILSGVVSVPALLAQTAAPSPAVTEAQLRAKLLAAVYIEAKVAEVRLNSDPKVVVAEYIHVINRTPDPIAARKVEFLKPLYDKAVESKFQPFIDKMAEALAKAQKEASGIEEVPITLTFRIDPETKVRTLIVPLDENGKPKKFSAEEMRKLKGDPRLPGLTATVENLEPYQKVWFYIDKVKFRPPKATKDKATEEDKTIYPLSMLVIQPIPAFNPKTDNPFLPPSKK